MVGYLTLFSLDTSGCIACLVTALLAHHNKSGYLTEVALPLPGHSGCSPTYLSLLSLRTRPVGPVFPHTGRLRGLTQARQLHTTSHRALHYSPLNTSCLPP
ncbi:hypothetical protein E2C01_005616 [Portunus trituberculatus]|uniref:Uncharacterized protein n=1 Tax=Portunus trituberculatus TaxID=210409 RepID=A0A5B7CVJ8_PORTR|nr:hypothetical protein [Portunus trituberculatus]